MCPYNHIAVGIDGKERGLEPLIANDALDGGAGLTLIEQDRLRIGNPPAIPLCQCDLRHLTSII
jgi:hypothetical protein